MNAFKDILDVPVVYAFDDPNAKYTRGETEYKQSGFFNLPVRKIHMNKHWIDNTPDDTQ